ncbi:MAG TPA: hypothetical protein DCZ69_00475 [Syntrophobacteraceae bacterium]|nr:hypothetical protein [Syntrophobacteraceae bacterium]HBD06710.1 hypothetical protein [Syntrophobacteraceae bacterium]
MEGSGLNWISYSELLANVHVMDVQRFPSPSERDVQIPCGYSPHSPGRIDCQLQLMRCDDQESAV